MHDGNPDEMWHKLLDWASTEKKQINKKKSCGKWHQININNYQIFVHSNNHRQQTFHQPITIVTVAAAAVAVVLKNQHGH